MNHLVNNILKTVRANTPEILTALGVGGVISTAVLTAKATLKAEKLIDADARFDKDCLNYFPDRKERRKEKVKKVWKLYIPPVASGAVTIAAIIASQKAGGRRTAAAVTAYSLTEKAFSEYKDAAVEKMGASQERRMRDDMAQEQVKAHPPSTEVVIIGDGEVLCCELRTNRYFRTTHEALQRAVNDINFQINHENYVSLSEFYCMIGLPTTDESVHNGWTFEQLLELDYSTALTDDNKPCLTFRYNYIKPLHDDPGPLRPPCE